MSISLNNAILEKNKFSFVLLLIIFLGLLYRLYLFNLYPFITFDSAEYARLGKNLVEYGNYSFSHDGSDNVGVIFPPGYPLLVGLANLIFNDLFVSGTIVSLLAGLLSIYLIYLISKELFGSEVGLFAAFCLSVCLPIADFSVKIMSESSYLAAILVYFLLFIKNVRKFSATKSIFIGVIAGFIFLARPEGILFLLFPLTHAYFLIKKNGADIRKILAAAVIPLIFFILVSSPYLLFLYNKTGKFVFSGKSGANIAHSEFLNGRAFQEVSAREYYQKFYALNEENTEIIQSDEFSKSLTESVIDNPYSFTTRYLKNVKLEFSQLLFYLSSTPLIFLLFVSFRNKRILTLPEIKTLLFFSLSLFAILPMYQVRLRYIFPVLMFLIIILSPSYVTLDKKVEKFIFHWHSLSDLWQKHLNFFCKNIKILTIFSLLVAAFFPLIRYNSPIFIEHKKAGDFIRNNISGEYEKINVMAIKNTVCFYANSKCVILPCAQTDRIIKYAKNKAVDYIVIDERYAGSYPNYKELINLDKISSEFEMVYESKDPTLIRVFKML